MKKIKQFLLSSLIFCMLILSAVTVRAENDVLWDGYTIPSERQKDLLYDGAQLLSADEQKDILSALESVSWEHKCNIAILTVYSHSGPIQDYADDYFDYNGFGADYDESGILFMLSMEDREWAISTSGSAIYAFTDYGQEALIDDMLPGLSSGNYYSAFKTYINTADYYLEMYESGSAYDINTAKSPRSLPQMAFLSLLFGFGVALIPIFVMKSQLKTVHSKAGAAGYQSHQGLNMRIHEDRYVRTSVVHRPIPTDNSSSGRSHSGGGSSVHTSSSRHSHGGSHGHF